MAAKLSPWRLQDGSPVVAVTDETADTEMAAAIAQARATASAARQRWSLAKLQERSRWAIKWAAPLGAENPSADLRERIEHVWIEPINWSPFRIEGLLASQPIHALACGKVLGELVSFPVEELSDWIHSSGPSFNEPYEGGFTVKLLHERFGKPELDRK